MVVVSTPVGPGSGAALAVVVGLLAEAPVTAIWAQTAKWLARSAEGSTLVLELKVQQPA